MNKEEIQKILHEAGTAPNKIRGQNFLIDDRDLELISGLIEKGTNVLEIGPGVGNLTDKLLEQGARITAVEIDGVFANYLSNKHGERVQVVHSDILHFDENQIARPYSVVGNIPYYITGKILRKFLESTNPPVRIVLTVQKEVAERVSARAPHASFISNVISLFAEVKLVSVIPSSHFWPAPKVDSAVILLEPHSSAADVDQELIKFIKTGFAQPRKTLKNNLKNALGVENHAIEDYFKRQNFADTLRPHEISLDSWKELFAHFGSK